MRGLDASALTDRRRHCERLVHTPVMLAFVAISSSSPYHEYVWTRNHNLLRKVSPLSYKTNQAPTPTSNNADRVLTPSLPTAEVGRGRPVIVEFMVEVTVRSKLVIVLASVDVQVVVLTLASDDVEAWSEVARTDSEMLLDDARVVRGGNVNVTAVLSFVNGRGCVAFASDVVSVE